MTSRNSAPLAVLGAVAAFAGLASAQQQPFQFSGAPCATPPALHCPDKDCPPDRVINPGPVVEMKSRRTYFLDYPCDLKPGEKVTFILSLHGFGSYGNWQRHYFPILDYKDKYRLVIATPNSPTHAWSAADDEYMQNIVTLGGTAMGKSAMMPPYGRMLSAEEIRSVISFTRAMAQPPYQPPARAGSVARGDAAAR